MDRRRRCRSIALKQLQEEEEEESVTEAGRNSKRILNLFSTLLLSHPHSDETAR